MQVELPDGSKREVPDGATVADVAASIGKRLAKDAIAGKVNGKVVDVYAGSRRREDRDRHAEERGRARHHPPLHRAPDGHGRAGALSRHAGHHRAGHRERLLLRLRHRPRRSPTRTCGASRRRCRRSSSAICRSAARSGAATRPSRRSRSSARSTRSRSSRASPATSRSRSTGRASGSISAAGRTSPPPAASARSS